MSEEVKVKDPKVIPIVDDYYLGADNYCLILYKARKITGGKAGKKPLEENIGKTDYTPIGYYTTLSGVYNAIVSYGLREAINSRGVKTLEDVGKKMDALVGRVKVLESKYVDEMVKRGMASV